ncbi:MAG: hexose kinase [Defluviitaleaceae bacterium]|nr:hexose kinase [Defluviitaleaceae bacterium]
MKIIVVSLNPCIDWQYTVPKYEHGELNRVQRTRSDVAGKGINVAIALKNLGLSPLCVGFNFAENGALLTQRLDALGVRHNFVEVNGAIRVNIKLYEETTKTMTELNQSGAFVAESAQAELLAKLENLNDEAGILVLSGSYPQGVPVDFYASICQKWRGKIFLDAEGEALVRAVDTGCVFAIKPNLFELTGAFGVSQRERLSAENPIEIAKFCREEIFSHSRRRGNLEIVCVSMGANGAVFATPENAFYCPALDVIAKGVAGAGDSMVAGMVYAYAKNFPRTKFLPCAMAAAAASITLDGTEMCTLEGFNTQYAKLHDFRGGIIAQLDNLTHSNI